MNKLKTSQTTEGDINIRELKSHLYPRNDIVHRNGRKKENMSEHHETEEDIFEKTIEEFRIIRVCESIYKAYLEF